MFVGFMKQSLNKPTFTHFSTITITWKNKVSRMCFKSTSPFSNNDFPGSH